MAVLLTAASVLYVSFGDTGVVAEGFSVGGGRVQTAARRLSDLCAPRRRRAGEADTAAVADADAVADAARELRAALAARYMRHVDAKVAASGVMVVLSWVLQR
jgi:hypothetical protein